MLSHLKAMQDMAIFVEVGRCNSFSAASSRLNMPIATVSRRVAHLERTLGLQLLIRTTRRVELTNVGRLYLERCGYLVDEASALHEQMQRKVHSVSGNLRVSMPVDLALYYIGSHIPEFMLQQPGVNLSLDLSPQKVDLATQKVDVAIRIGEPDLQGVVAKRIGAIRMSLYAAPTYAQTHHLSASHSEAGNGVVIGGYPEPIWKLLESAAKGFSVLKGRVSANNVSMMRLLAERGLGIALLPVQLGQESVLKGSLIAVLDSSPMCVVPVYALTLSRRQPAVVRAFIEFLALRLQ